MSELKSTDELVVHLRDRPGTCVSCGSRVPAGLAGAVGPAHEPVCRECMARLEPELAKLFSRHTALRRRFRAGLRERPASIRFTGAAGACGRCGTTVGPGLTMVVQREPLCRACAMGFDPELAGVALAYRAVEPLVAADVLMEAADAVDAEAWREALALLFSRTKVLRMATARRLLTEVREESELMDENED